jgi:uncharacterized protein with HEPN domain
MPFQDIPSRLEDILDAIQEIEGFIFGKSYDDCLTDAMLRLALERCVEIMSEASRHIPAEMKAGHPEVPWKRVADIGNVLRHAYRNIDPHIVWDVATRHVVPLRRAAEQMLTEIEPPQKG